MQALCDVYGDLLQFCKGARNVFTDETGGQRRGYHQTGCIHSQTNAGIYRLDVI